MLLSGFALGGAPGFVVGALAALASNLFFGQGPWTPWQMAALGARPAWRARCSRGEPAGGSAACRSRSCGRRGLAFGAIMDFSIWVTFTGDPSARAYVAIAGVSLPFNVAHAVGNVVFCLAFGPAFVRVLERFRRRSSRAGEPRRSAAGAARSR